MRAPKRILFQIIIYVFNFFSCIHIQSTKFNITLLKHKYAQTLQGKISKVELHLFKTFLWWLSSNFAIFSCELSVTFDFGHDILYLKT